MMIFRLFSRRLMSSKALKHTINTAGYYRPYWSIGDCVALTYLRTGQYPPRELQHYICYQYGSRDDADVQAVQRINSWQNIAESLQRTVQACRSRWNRSVTDVGVGALPTAHYNSLLAKHELATLRETKWTGNEI